MADITITGETFAAACWCSLAWLMLYAFTLAFQVARMGAQLALACGRRISCLVAACPGIRS